MMHKAEFLEALRRYEPQPTRRMDLASHGSDWVACRNTDRPLCRAVPCEVTP